MSSDPLLAIKDNGGNDFGCCPTSTPKQEPSDDQSRQKVKFEKRESEAAFEMASRVTEYFFTVQVLKKVKGIAPKK